MTTVCFLDTETTGLDPALAAVWEVSWQVFDHQPATAASTPGRLVALAPRRTYLITLAPHQLADADPIALDIGGYAERQAQMSHSAGYTLARLRADLRLGDEKPALVGACPWFDDGMLARWWGGSVNDRPWHYHLVDIETLIAGAVDPPAVAPWEYKDLLSRIGVYLNEATKHTASGDVDVVIAAYAAIYRLEVVE